jgi:hypothetical protein
MEWGIMHPWIFAALLALPASPPASATQEAEPPRSGYVESRGYGTRRDLNPPAYSRRLDQVDWPKLQDLGWLDFGADYRVRWEARDGDLRRPVAARDEPFLTRLRIYAGIHDVLDPLRFHVEVIDSRFSRSDFDETNRETNEFDLLQAAAEIFLGDALGSGRPLRLQAGRLTMEYLDRRLLALNQWRNTSNTFQGFRAMLGEDRNDWQLDLLALRPVLREVDESDKADEDQAFYGAIGSWRRWSDIVTLQPFYLGRRVDPGPGVVERRVHTVGLRGYGSEGPAGFDYDASLVWQFGTAGGGDHRAGMITSEVGYTIAHEWKPRIGLFSAYVTGDEDPADPDNQRFDRLFGFARPWSANDYIAPENLVAGKVRAEVQPHELVSADAGYGAFWLASRTDAWVSANNLRDVSGRSGRFLGHELDLRLKVKLSRLDTTLGYAWFSPGEFTRQRGRPDDTHFFYVELAARLFP